MLLVVLGLVTGCGQKNSPKGSNASSPKGNSPGVPTATLPADQTPLRNAIQAQVDEMFKKLMNGDADGFLTFLHPDIIKLSGGLDNLKQQLAPAFATFPQSIDKIKVGEISEIVADKGGLSAFVQVETVYRNTTGKGTKKSYYIASSTDQGKTWKFLEGRGRKDQEAFFQSRFPVLTSKFPFPVSSPQ